MRSHAVIHCLLIALIFSGCQQKTVDAPPPAVDSGFTREIFDINKYPALTAVGKISFLGGRWCSMILVSEDIGVTAGHCFLESNKKFDLSKDLEPYSTVVIFKPDGVRRIENIAVKRVLTARMKPDYAIVKLSRKIPPSEITPLKISNLSPAEIRAKEEKLGCAGYNGDRELGSEGLLMTISRHLKIISESSTDDRIDASCFSTYGGSGGLLFEAVQNTGTKADEYGLIGVIWGFTDEKLNDNGELVKTEKVVTSITPVSVFYDELSEIINKNKEQKRWQKRN